jgi:hypothetical protein
LQSSPGNGTFPHVKQACFWSGKLRRAARFGLRAFAPSILATAAFAASASATLTPARTAGSFRDSVGVNTHMSFGGTAYANTNIAVLQGLLSDLGVAHVRDSSCFLTAPNCKGVLTRLAALSDSDAGKPAIGLTLGVTPTLDSTVDRTARDGWIKTALDYDSTFPLKGKVEALEQANEPDLDTPNWKPVVVGDAQTTKSLLASGNYPSLSTTPVEAPSMGSSSSVGSLNAAAGWLPSFVQRGNLHPYPTAYGIPEDALNPVLKNATTSASCDGGAVSPSVTVSALLRCQSTVSGSDPVDATESGYSTEGDQTTSGWVDNKAEAIYLPRVLLENFRRGISRTFLYELIDSRAIYTSRGDAYGLVTSRLPGGVLTAGSKKPAFNAISRMLGEIGDLGVTGGRAAPLDVTVADPDKPGVDVPQTAVRRVLLERADGTYVLALWEPKAVWDESTPYNHHEVSVAPSTYQVSLGAPGSTWNIARFAPTSSALPLGAWVGKQSITIPIGADVTLLSFGAEPKAPGGWPKWWPKFRWPAHFWPFW